ncbi:MAG: calcium-binding protein [Phenylobacterium sp.]|uniref:calcium-binding protein n=1 Tax=Phenylobacterium sp. TaxID=1871053 RepID=UPI00121A0194|nr:calcium-binding protein [Phenylobacterium sp.]TAJ72223.1 MAG: calcium-binding protein [Phenylobacterium sp.]
MAIFTAAVGVDFDTLDLGPLGAASASGASSTSVLLTVGGVTAQLTGTGFQFAGAGPPTAGTITRIVVTDGGAPAYDIAVLALPAASFRSWVLAGDNAGTKAGIFGGADQITGSFQADRLGGFAGGDTINAGEGNDTVTDTGGANYLRGDGGADSLQGGVDFDDINGNVGADTIRGGLGDDWVVGGKDDDLIFGDDGGDLVYGNLGADTCEGGAGADIVRGGQGNDTLSGGPGDDFVSGDRGDDVMTGGLGADRFHSSSDAGLDRVLDFSLAQGDRVQLDPGTTYSVSQSGDDTVIAMSAGQVVLVGVSMSSLTADSIFIA